MIEHANMSDAKNSGDVRLTIEIPPSLREEFAVHCTNLKPRMTMKDRLALLMVKDMRTTAERHAKARSRSKPLSPAR
jgi:hypothetical protein